MIFTFSLFDTQAIKEKCLDLVNKNTSFSVKLIKDSGNNPRYWEIKEFVN